MARVTDSEVKQIISLNEISDTAPFIDTATVIVDEHLMDSGMSDSILKKIELYLTAHLVTLHPSERQLTESRMGDAQDKYTGKFSQGLDSTQFGQMVKILDYTGKLTNMTGKTATIAQIEVTYDS